MRRGRNDRLELRADDTRTGDLTGLIGRDGTAKPLGTIRLIVWPVSRSIARIADSSIGATIEIASPLLPALPVRPTLCT